MNGTWQNQLKTFFDLRGQEIDSTPTVEDLCYVSGREPRLWCDARLQDDLKASLLSQMAIGADSHVLEVGAGSGFLARLIAPAVKSYTGVDLAEGAIAVARKLGLKNADFKTTDGAALPFPDASFDAAYCYDVYTNFPSFDDGAPLISEMVRVVKPGGRILAGSIPDAELREPFLEKVKEVVRALDEHHGPLEPRPQISPVSSHEVAGTQGRSTWLEKLFSLLSRKSVSEAAGEASEQVTPQIVTYDFDRSDFEEFGQRRGLITEIHPLHALHPYAPFRFNVVYQVPPK